MLILSDLLSYISVWNTTFLYKFVSSYKYAVLVNGIFSLVILFTSVVLLFLLFCFSSFLLVQGFSARNSYWTKFNLFRNLNFSKF